jgi:hypothetical protein
VYPFTSSYGTYSGFTCSGWPADIKGNFEHNKIQAWSSYFGTGCELASVVGRLWTY